MHATQERHYPLKDGFSMPRAHATPHTPHACNPRRTQPTQRWVLDTKSACDITHTTCATQGRHNPLKDGFSIPRAHATSHTPHVCNPRQTQPTQGWVFDTKSTCDTTRTTCMQPKADTTHSKMGSRYQEHMRHHTHHMHATQDRHNPLKDGFSIPRAHVTPHTPHACHSRKTLPTQRWVLNAKSACDTTQTTCMQPTAETTHSRMGSRYQEHMRHHTHHMHATQERHYPLKDGFSMPRAHTTPHTQHACHPRRTQPTQRWILDTKSACDTTHTTCMPLKTDTTHSKMDSQCQECMRYHTDQMHATQGGHNPLKDGFSIPRAHETPHTPHACHSRQTQPTERWLLTAKSACDTTHTTCMQPKADTTHSKMGHHTHHMHATQDRHNPLKDGFSMPRAHATPHTPHACHSRKTQPTQDGFSIPRAHVTPHTPHACHSRQTLPTQRWVLNAKSACDTTHTTCMQPKADTAHSKMGSRYQERMRHHTHHMHATQERHYPLKDGFSMPRAHATPHRPHACNPRRTQPTQRWVLDTKSA